MPGNWTGARHFLERNPSLGPFAALAENFSADSVVFAVVLVEVGAAP